eukprot:3943950-Alexandrium_andersonii.AAC.1
MRAAYWLPRPVLAAVFGLRAPHLRCLVFRRGGRVSGSRRRGRLWAWSGLLSGSRQRGRLWAWSARLAR